MRRSILQDQFSTSQSSATPQYTIKPCGNVIDKIITSTFGIQNASNIQLLYQSEHSLIQPHSHHPTYPYNDENLNPAGINSSPLQPRQDSRSSYQALKFPSNLAQASPLPLPTPFTPQHGCPRSDKHNQPSDEQPITQRPQPLRSSKLITQPQPISGSPTLLPLCHSNQRQRRESQRSPNCIDGLGASSIPINSPFAHPNLDSVLLRIVVEEVPQPHTNSLPSRTDLHAVLPSTPSTQAIPPPTPLIHQNPPSGRDLGPKKTVRYRFTAYKMDPPQPSGSSPQLSTSQHPSTKLSALQATPVTSGPNAPQPLRRKKQFLFMPKPHNPIRSLPTTPPRHNAGQQVYQPSFRYQSHRRSISNPYLPSLIESNTPRAISQDELPSKPTLPISSTQNIDASSIITECISEEQRLHAIQHNPHNHALRSPLRASVHYAVELPLSPPLRSRNRNPFQTPTKNTQINHRSAVKPDTTTTIHNTAHYASKRFRFHPKTPLILPQKSTSNPQAVTIDHIGDKRHVHHPPTRKLQDKDTISVHHHATPSKQSTSHASARKGVLLSSPLKQPAMLNSSGQRHNDLITRRPPQYRISSKMSSTLPYVSPVKSSLTKQSTLQTKIYRSFYSPGSSLSIHVNPLSTQPQQQLTSSQTPSLPSINENSNKLNKQTRFRFVSNTNPQPGLTSTFYNPFEQTTTSHNAKRPQLTHLQYMKRRHWLMLSERNKSLLCSCQISFDMQCCEYISLIDGSFIEFCIESITSEAELDQFVAWQNAVRVNRQDTIQSPSQMKKPDCLREEMVPVSKLVTRTSILPQPQSNRSSTLHPPLCSMHPRPLEFDAITNDLSFDLDSIKLETSEDIDLLYQYLETTHDAKARASLDVQSQKVDSTPNKRVSSRNPSMISEKVNTSPKPQRLDSSELQSSPTHTVVEPSDSFITLCRRRGPAPHLDDFQPVPPHHPSPPTSPLPTTLDAFHQTERDFEISQRELAPTSSSTFLQTPQVRNDTFNSSFDFEEEESSTTPTTQDQKAEESQDAGHDNSQLVAALSDMHDVESISTSEVGCVEPDIPGDDLVGDDVRTISSNSSKHDCFDVDWDDNQEDKLNDWLDNMSDDEDIIVQSLITHPKSVIPKSFLSGLVSNCHDNDDEFSQGSEYYSPLKHNPHTPCPNTSHSPQLCLTPIKSCSPQSPSSYNSNHDLLEVLPLVEPHQLYKHLLQHITAKHSEGIINNCEAESSHKEENHQECDGPEMDREDNEVHDQTPNSSPTMTLLAIAEVDYLPDDTTSVEAISSDLNKDCCSSQTTMLPDISPTTSQPLDVRFEIVLTSHPEQFQRHHHKSPPALPDSSHKRFLADASTNHTDQSPPLIDLEEHYLQDQACDQSSLLNITQTAPLSPSHHLPTTPFPATVTYSRRTGSIASKSLCYSPSQKLNFFSHQQSHDGSFQTPSKSTNPAQPNTSGINLGGEKDLFTIHNEIETLINRYTLTSRKPKKTGSNMNAKLRSPHQSNGRRETQSTSKSHKCRRHKAESPVWRYRTADELSQPRNSDRDRSMEFNLEEADQSDDDSIEFINPFARLSKHIPSPTPISSDQTLSPTSAPERIEKTSSPLRVSFTSTPKLPHINKPLCSTLHPTASPISQTSDYSIRLSEGDETHFYLNIPTTPQKSYQPHRLSLTFHHNSSELLSLQSHHSTPTPQIDASSCEDHFPNSPHLTPIKSLLSTPSQLFQTPTLIYSSTKTQYQEQDSPNTAVIPKAPRRMTVFWSPIRGSESNYQSNPISPEPSRPQQFPQLNNSLDQFRLPTLSGVWFEDTLNEERVLNNSQAHNNSTQLLQQVEQFQCQSTFNLFELPYNQSQLDQIAALDLFFDDGGLDLSQQQQPPSPIVSPTPIWLTSPTRSKHGITAVENGRSILRRSIQQFQTQLQSSFDEQQNRAVLFVHSAIQRNNYLIMLNVWRYLVASRSSPNPAD